MKELWDRIRAWFTKNGLPEHLEWAPPATEEEIAAAEAELGVRLPHDLRETYQLLNGDGDSGIFQDHYLLPLHGVVRRWKTLTEALEAGLFSEMVPAPKGPI